MQLTRCLVGGELLRRADGGAVLVDQFEHDRFCCAVRRVVRRGGWCGRHTHPSLWTRPRAPVPSSLLKSAVQKRLVRTSGAGMSGPAAPPGRAGSGRRVRPRTPPDTRSCPARRPRNHRGPGPSSPRRAPRNPAGFRTAKRARNRTSGSTRDDRAPGPATPRASVRHRAGPVRRPARAAALIRGGGCHRSQCECGFACDQAAGQQGAGGEGSVGRLGDVREPGQPGRRVLAQGVDQIGFGLRRERGGVDRVHGGDVGSGLGTGGPADSGGRVPRIAIMRGGKGRKRRVVQRMVVVGQRGQPLSDSYIAAKTLHRGFARARVSGRASPRARRGRSAPAGRCSARRRSGRRDSPAVHGGASRARSSRGTPDAPPHGRRGPAFPR